MGKVYFFIRLQILPAILKWVIFLWLLVEEKTKKLLRTQKQTSCFTAIIFLIVFEQIECYICTQVILNRYIHDILLHPYTFCPQHFIPPKKYSIIGGWFLVNSVLFWYQKRINQGFTVVKKYQRTKCYAPCNTIFITESIAQKTPFTYLKRKYKSLFK